MHSQSGPASPEPCLVHSRRTRFRGGTVIAPDVHDLPEHERRLRDADHYRPELCGRYGGQRLHVHDRPQRVLFGDSTAERIAVMRYICATDNCRATWRVLPAFVARHLWRRWSTVARTIAGDPGESKRPPVPPRTRRRWNARLRAAGRQLVLLLGQHDDESVARFASVAGFDCTRHELVELFTAGRVLGIHALADIASTLQALEPGIRLM